MKLLSDAQKAVVQKDFREMWDVPIVRNTLLIVALLLAVGLPVLFLVIVWAAPANAFHGMDRVAKLLPPEAQHYNSRQSSFYMLTNLLGPMLFLMIPLMSSCVSAVSSFVGEKERGTLVTLLLTPLGVRGIFKAKVLGCIFLSAVITAVSFVALSVSISVGDILLGLPFFLNWDWLVLVFLFAPAITVFGVVFMVLVSARSKSYNESIQTSGFLVLPIVLLFVGQFVGLFSLNARAFLIVSLAVILVDIPLWLLSARSFTAEKLLRQ